MRLVLQRTKQSSVRVDNQVIGETGLGFVILVGVSHDDTKADVDLLVRKVTHLRVFEDEDGKMNLSLQDVAGSVLSISQFTLYASLKKGNRPSFTQAASPNEAEALYDYFNEQLRATGIPVETGAFGAMMDLQIQNDGPVTIIMETSAGKIVG